MKLTGIEKRAERKARNHTGLDMNLVSLIDIFTILIFFLMSSAAGVEILNTSKAVKLPESHADKMPRETVVIVVAGQDLASNSFSKAITSSTTSRESAPRSSMTRRRSPRWATVTPS